MHSKTLSFFLHHNSVDGIPSVCESGMCRAAESDADIDLCQYFNYPCGGGGRNVKPNPRDETMSKLDELI